MGESEEEQATADEAPADRLALAKDCVAQLESVGAAARSSFPDFEERLTEARRNRDILQRERRDARPVRWRLVEAERVAKTKATAAEKARAGLHDLLQQLESVQAKAAEQRLSLARAEQEHKQAEEAVTAVRTEIAREAAPLYPGLEQRAAQILECTAAVAQGIALQVAGLPAALANNNATAALVAIQVQTDALMAAVMQARAPIIPEGVAAGAAEPQGGTATPIGYPPAAAYPPQQLPGTPLGAPLGAPSTPLGAPVHAPPTPLGPSAAAGTPRHVPATPLGAPAGALPTTHEAPGTPTVPGTPLGAPLGAPLTPRGAPSPAPHTPLAAAPPCSQEALGTPTVPGTPSCGAPSPSRGRRSGGFTPYPTRRSSSGASHRRARSLSRSRSAEDGDEDDSDEGGASPPLRTRSLEQGRRELGEWFKRGAAPREVHTRPSPG